MIHRTRQLGDGTKQEEQSDFISSLEPREKEITTRLRDHWGIQNGLHQILEVMFGEDANRIRKGNGPEIIFAYRRLALWTLKMDTTVKDNVWGRRMIAGWDLPKLEGILLAFQAARTGDCPSTGGRGLVFQPEMNSVSAQEQGGSIS